MMKHPQLARPTKFVNDQWQAVKASLILLLLLTSHSALAATDIEVERQTDIAYGSHPQQTLDAYLPPESLRNRKILVMVHGGAWRFGDKGNAGVVENKLDRWLPEGYIFVSVNYRLLPEFGPAIQAEDVASAVAKVQQLAPGWGTRPENIILMGHSAGAHLSALITADRQRATSMQLKPWLGTILLDTTVLDLEQFMSERHAPVFSRTFGNDKSVWAKLSPLHHLTSKTVPTLLVCSTRRKKSCPHNQRYYEKAKQLGIQTDIVKVDLSHADVNRNLGNDSPYTRVVAAFMNSVGQ